MGKGPNAYGDEIEIGALVPKWSGTDGDFASTTRPAIKTVFSWMDQVSGTLNIILAKNGFDIPITETTSKLSLDSFVNRLVAELVEGVNGSGKYGPAAMGSTKRHNKGRDEMIMFAAAIFIEEMAVGFERLGATRNQSVFSEVGFRETDESGDTPVPIFEREAFGETYKEWDD